MPQPWDGLHLEDRAGFDQRTSCVCRDEVDSREATSQRAGRATGDLERALGQVLVVAADLLASAVKLDVTRGEILRMLERTGMVPEAARK